ncbi:MAG: ROK family protein [Planctomycetia bacterium]|nr:ROK family protein [Planctomycetia bacterium]
MYLVFDLGGTKMRMAFSPDGENLEQPSVFSTPADFKDGMAAFATKAHELARGRPIRAVAGSVVGVLDPDHSMVLVGPNVPGWCNQPLKAEVQGACGTPQVFLENDTTMAGLGEVTRGAGRGHSIVAYITVSTGIGGKRFVNRKPEPSAFGFEPGHHIVQVDGVECTCGMKGHLEGYASGNGLRKRYGKAPEHIDDVRVWEEVTTYLAAGLINVTVFWSPDAIVLGGSMMQRIPLDRLAARMQQLGTIFGRIPELKSAQLGDAGGLVGALAYLAALENGSPWHDKAK